MLLRLRREPRVGAGAGSVCGCRGPRRPRRAPRSPSVPSRHAAQPRPVRPGQGSAQLLACGRPGVPAAACPPYQVLLQLLHRHPAAVVLPDGQRRLLLGAGQQRGVHVAQAACGAPPLRCPCVG